MIKTIARVFAALVFAHAVVCAAPTLVLTPGPDLIAYPGQYVGWGFQLFADPANTTEIAVVTGADFLTYEPLGPVTDLISRNLVLLSAGLFGQPVWIQEFRPAIDSGLVGVQVAASAVPGTTSSGFIVVQYDLYSAGAGGFLFDLGNSYIGSGMIVQPALITIVTPEPATSILVLAALFAIGVIQRGCVGLRVRREATREPRARHA